jgi:hypothetical protein
MEAEAVLRPKDAFGRRGVSQSAASRRSRIFRALFTKEEMAAHLPMSINADTPNSIGKSERIQSHIPQPSMPCRRHSLDQIKNLQSAITG